MERITRPDMGLLPSVAVQRALDAGDFAGARAHRESLAKEFVLMHKGLRVVVELLLEHNARVLRRELAASGKAIARSIAAADGAALRAVREMQDRHWAPMNDALAALESGCEGYLRNHFGEEVLAECARHVAEGWDNANDSAADHQDGAETVVLAALQTALADGEHEVAVDLCDALVAADLLAIERASAKAGLLLSFIEGTFRRTQAAIAEQITVAVDKGDAARAAALLAQKRRQHLDIHDVAIAFMATSFSWVYTALGDAALYDCQRWLAESQRRGFADWERLSPEDFARSTAYLLALHADGKVTVEEDDEKFSVISDPCGTGGKMLRDGLYDPPAARYARVSRPQPMTFHVPDYPTYCTHCAVWNGIAPIEWFGHPQWVHVPMRRAADPCVIHIYKDPRNVPAEYYQSVGKDRPTYIATPTRVPS